MRNVCVLDVHKNNVFVCIFKENQTQFLLLPLMKQMQGYVRKHSNRRNRQ